ncbi:hypothetical protein [Rubinisphaera italica]|uniref:Phage tail assembly chaperone n=1 Tax=Rubinisphaera italica TaxID=2527969 RepID=A0A5C5XNE2_9PLAN|nr:hypothetical protein [Rubinisphaera italica]TWT64238.1 hypothetical protein Pan54_49990 [Rubinisphaera italica]
MDKDKIFKSTQVDTREVADLWGGESLWVRPVTARQYSDLESLNIELALSLQKGKFDNKLKQQFKNHLLIWSTCDSRGKLIFDEDDLENIEGLNSQYVERLLEAAMRVNPFTKAERANLEKNSEAAPDGSESYQLL